MTAGLAISGLSAGYDGNDVLHGVDLPHTPPGRIVALIGPNATGKSTLLKTLARQVKYRGQASFDGGDIAAMSPDAHRQAVGYLPQTPVQISSLMAYEYVLSALMASGGRSRAVIERDIAQVFDTLQLTAQALRPLSELSGGKRELVGLAQVLVRQARLMLLDEPTSALDLRWQVEVLDILKRVAAETGAIAVIALHDVSLALRHCDDVVVMTGGRIIAAGRPTDVISADILQQAYGVSARVERCSQGYPIAIVDGAAAI